VDVDNVGDNSATKLLGKIAMAFNIKDVDVEDQAKRMPSCRCRLKMRC
jgi:hypothetical protein